MAFRLGSTLHVLTLVAAMAISSSLTVPDILDLGDVATIRDPGSNVAQCWRLKSLVRSNGLRDGFEWAVPSIMLYEEEDCSGSALNVKKCAPRAETLSIQKCPECRMNRALPFVQTCECL